MEWSSDPKAREGCKRVRAPTYERMQFKEVSHGNQV